MSELTSDKIITTAREWIGTPYIHQASLKHVGCDCLGLLRGIWRECVGDEPEPFTPYTPDWAEAKNEETLAAAGFRHFDRVEINEAGAADIVLFRWRTHVPAKHVGILTSANTMTHAHGGVNVCEVPLSSWWKRRIAYAFRFRSLTIPLP